MNKRGFTLIELLIVIAIIGLLAALILPNIMDSAAKAKLLATKSIITNLKQPMKEYALKNPFGLFPEASEEEEGNGTTQLVEDLRDGNFFQFEDSNLTDEEPYQLVDAWGAPMRYHPWHGKKVNKDTAHNKKSYDLWSAGPNGEFDDTSTDPDENDDITNWSKILDDEDSN